MSNAERMGHTSWLLEITQIPTAAGREGRVIEWIRGWVAERPGLGVTADAAGNLVVAPRGAERAGPEAAPPLFITAHLDHPAFVVERIVGPSTVQLSFRGGVMDVFFEDAPIVIHSGTSGRVPATLTGTATHPDSPHFKSYLADLRDGHTTEDVKVGDVGTWDVRAAGIEDGLLHTNACDDLALVAAAVCAMDSLLTRAAAGERVGDVRLLFTRAEEVGFIGAIAACKHGTMPKEALVIALEASRSFADSPIGGGPIVRVGDRMSIFTPWLTAACAKRAEEIFARPAQPVASQAGGGGGRPWQRKLMAGGACEASVYCAYGYQATCLCLPLGNYHNMAHLAELQEGSYDRARLGPPRAAREFISVEDFHGMVDLLVALGSGVPPVDSTLGRIERLYSERAFVLGE